MTMILAGILKVLKISAIVVIIVGFFVVLYYALLFTAIMIHSYFCNKKRKREQ